MGVAFDAVKIVEADIGEDDRGASSASLAGSAMAWVLCLKRWRRTRARTRNIDAAVRSITHRSFA